MAKRSLPLAFDDLQAADLARVVAVLAGVEDYQPSKNKIDGVSFASADATEFRDVLSGIYGEKLEATLLVDSLATRSSLEHELNRAIASLTKNDLFVFYFVGHGFHAATGNYVAAFDTVLGDITGTGLSFDKTIIDALETSECERALIFVDACARPGTEMNGLTGLRESELAAFLNATSHAAVYVSCKPGQASYPSKTLKHGIWTHFIVQALRGVDAALNADGVLTDVSLRDYLTLEIPKYIRSNTTIKGNQEPYAIVNASGSFRMPSIPKPARTVSKGSDLSAISGTIRREYFEDVQDGSIRRLPGFVPGRHAVPKIVTRNAQFFVASLVQPQIVETLQETYASVRSAFGLRRSEITRSEDGAVGTLDTEHFRFEIRGELNPDDPTEYRVTRTLELRRYLDDTVAAFDEVFGTFDSAVIEFDVRGLDFEEVVGHLEDLADDHGGHAVDGKEIVEYRAPSGDTIVIDFGNERIKFSIPCLSLPSAIIERLATYRFGLTGQSKLLIES